MNGDEPSNAPAVAPAGTRPVYRATIRSPAGYIPDDVPPLDPRRPAEDLPAYAARTAISVLSEWYPGASMPPDPVDVLEAITSIMEALRANGGTGSADHVIAATPTETMASIARMHAEAVAYEAEEERLAARPHNEGEPLASNHEPQGDQPDLQPFLDIMPASMTLLESISAYIESNRLRIPEPAVSKSKAEESKPTELKAAASKAAASKASGSKAKGKGKAKAKAKSSSTNSQNTSDPSSGSSKAKSPSTDGPGTTGTSAGPTAGPSTGPSAGPSAGPSKGRSGPSASQPSLGFVYPNPARMTIGEIKDDIRYVFYGANPDARFWMWFSLEVLARTIQKKFAHDAEALNRLHPSTTLGQALAPPLPAAAPTAQGEPAAPRKLNANQRKARAKRRRAEEAASAAGAAAPSSSAPDGLNGGPSNHAGPSHTASKPSPENIPSREYINNLNLDPDGDMFRFMLRLGDEHVDAMERMLMSMSEKVRGKQRMP